MDRADPTMVYTYADLRRIHAERLKAAQKSNQEFRNHSSALNLFAGVAGKSDANECGEDFTDKFDTHLTRLTELLSAKGIATTSIANKVSYVRAIRDTYKVMLTNVVLTGDFRESLIALLQTRKVTQVELAKAVGVPKQAINSWVKRGQLPTAVSKGTISKIERFFKVPEGSLMGKIDVCCAVYQPREEKSPRLESRTKRYELSKDAYYYKEPSTLIREEWAELVSFYTAPYLLNGFERNITWRVKDADKVTTYCGWEAEVPGGICVTANIRWKSVASFLGFLIRPKDRGGKGMDKSQLTLALLTDARLMVDFIEFKRKRSGKYTGESERFLAFCGSLLRKETGFLWQQSQYGERLSKPISKENWQKWCNDNCDTIHTMMKGLRKGGHIQKGREPQEPIEEILAEASPIQALIKMTERMSQQFTLAARPVLVAIRKRNLLLVKMMISNPLRVHHFSIMAYQEDNKGNLYQDAYGAWRLRFRPDDFKNQRGAASSDYDVALSSWLYSDIAEYLTKYRPTLAYAQESDRVFLPSKQGGRGKNRMFWDPNKITGCIREITKRFIPGSPGFGAHAFRHIVATDYIKNNPNGFQVAANILHDRLDTVMKEYAHIKVADGFSHWSAYLEGQIALAGGSVNE